jgi:hypothetical protein
MKKWLISSSILVLVAVLLSIFSITRANQKNTTESNRSAINQKHRNPTIIKKPVYTDPKDVATAKKAEKLLAGVRGMFEEDYAKYRALGKVGVDVLLPHFQKKALAYDLNPESDDGMLHTEAQQKAYYEFLASAQLLEAVMTKDRTKQMLDMLDDYNDSWVRRWIVKIVTKNGDAKLAAPVLTRILKTKDSEDVLTDEAKDIIFASVNPEVTAYLTTVIADPKADCLKRQEACISVAASEDPKAIRTILSHRNTTRTIPNIAQAMQLDKLCTKVSGANRKCDHPACVPSLSLVAKKTDKNGVLWGLIASVAAGRNDDLWISRYDKNHWSSPVFTGSTTKNNGKSYWFAKYVGNKLINKDSDSDGWTDLLEKRLGTDPNKADTDDDGLQDSNDMNPLSAPRNLSENEQITAAVFDAMQQFTSAGDTPCLITLPDGAKPFEVSGWGWIVTSQTSKRHATLSKYTGHGLAHVSIGSPMYDFNGKRLSDVSSNSSVLMNKDHTRAKVGYFVSYHPLMGNGYDIELKKIKGHWFAIKRKFTIIS